MDRCRFTELSSGSIAGDIVDTNGDPVPAASLTASVLTLFDAETGELGSPALGILNDRLAQNVLNTNDVTIDTDGHFIWSIQPEDNVIVTPRRQVERHRAMFLFTWADGTFRFEVELEVVNLRMAS